jgi:hypothetical protein
MRLPPDVEAKALALAGAKPARGRDRPEAAFQAQVVQLAELFRWKAYHTLDSRGSEEGFPDLVLARPGLVLMPELKVPPNVPTAAQLEWVRILDRAVVRSEVWRPEDWPAIERLLRGRDEAVRTGGRPTRTSSSGSWPARA